MSIPALEDSTILAAERIDGGTVVNLGTIKRVRLIDPDTQVMNPRDHEADEFKLLPEMTTGPYNCFAGNSIALERMLVGR